MVCIWGPILGCHPDSHLALNPSTTATLDQFLSLLVRTLIAEDIITGTPRLNLKAFKHFSYLAQQRAGLLRSRAPLPAGCPDTRQVFRFVGSSERNLLTITRRGNMIDPPTGTIIWTHLDNDENSRAAPSSAQTSTLLKNGNERSRLTTMALMKDGFIRSTSQGFARIQTNRRRRRLLNCHQRADSFQCVRNAPAGPTMERKLRY